MEIVETEIVSISANVNFHEICSNLSDDGLINSLAFQFIKLCAK